METTYILIISICYNKFAIFILNSQLHSNLIINKIPSSLQSQDFNYLEYIETFLNLKC